MLGVTRDKIMQGLQQVRGSQRVTDQNPEDKYQALEKYGRDLTELARRGKIDPVIGRDNEIRRSCRCCRGGRKIIRCSSAIRVWARPPSWKGSLDESSAATCRSR